MHVGCWGKIPALSCTRCNGVERCEYLFGVVEVIVLDACHGGGKLMYVHGFGALCVFASVYGLGGFGSVACVFVVVWFLDVLDVRWIGRHGWYWSVCGVLWMEIENGGAVVVVFGVWFEYFRVIVWSVCVCVVGCELL